MTLGLKTFCLNEIRTAYVVADMLELRGLDNRAHCLILSAWAPHMLWDPDDVQISDR